MIIVYNLGKNPYNHPITFQICSGAIFFLLFGNQLSEKFSKKLQIMNSQREDLHHQNIRFTEHLNSPRSIRSKLLSSGKTPITLHELRMDLLLVFVRIRYCRQASEISTKNSRVILLSSGEVVISATGQTKVYSSSMLYSRLSSEKLRVTNILAGEHSRILSFKEYLKIENLFYLSYGDHSHRVRKNSLILRSIVLSNHHTQVLSQHIDDFSGQNHSVRSMQNSRKEVWTK